MGTLVAVPGEEPVERLCRLFLSQKPLHASLLGCDKRMVFTVIFLLMLLV